MTLKCPFNKILVTIEKKYQDKEKGLFIDTTYHPEEYATLKGVVHSVPARLKNEHWREETQQIIQPGDEIWFSFYVVYSFTRYENNETPSYKNLIVFEGQEYWQVDYSEVFCVKRGDEIIMPYQYVLLEPMKDDRNLKSKSGLIITHNETFQDRAKVKALPKINVDCTIGDIIPIEQQYVQKYRLFDSLHYILPVRRLIAKF